MPGPWEAYQSGAQSEAGPWAKYGAKPAPAPTPAPPPESHPISDFAGNFVKQINPFPGLYNAVRHPIDTATNALGAQLDQFKKAGADLSNTKEMPNLSDRLMSAGGHALAGAIPLVGPAAASAGEQIGSGDIAGGLGSAAGLIGSVAATPSIAKGVGKGFSGVASPIAEKALGITKNDRGFGASPGRGILRDTSGIRPETIAQSAQDKISQLTPQLEDKARQSTTPASIAPAKKILTDKMASQKAGNSVSGPNEIQPMLHQLTEPQAGFTGAVSPGAPVPVPSKVLQPNGQPVMTTQPGPTQVSDLQPPIELLKMKRQFGQDFSKFKPGATQPVDTKAANQAYHAMGQEFNRAVPGAADLNQRIQDLIPVKRAGESASRNEGLVPHVMTRIEKPTGALVPSLLGYAAGGAGGAALGTLIPEALSAPSVRMITARGLHGVGKALQSPVTGRAAQVAPLVKGKE